MSTKVLYSHIWHAHVYNNNRLGKRLVVFGGKDNDGNVLGDTWLFSLDTMQWTQLDVIGSAAAPPKRFSMVAGIDQGDSRNRFLIAVGEGSNNDGSRAFYNDVWELDLVPYARRTVVVVWQPQKL